MSICRAPHAEAALSAVPGARRLLFTFTDDGSELWAAEPKLGSADMVIVVEHFSGCGFADLAGKAREAAGKGTERYTLTPLGPAC